MSTPCECPTALDTTERARWHDLKNREFEGRLGRGQLTAGERAELDRLDARMRASAAKCRCS